MQMYMSKPRLGVVAAAWANRPSHSTPGVLFFATDVGEYGTYFQATGSRWRALNGVALLKNLGAEATGITNTESIAAQTLIPAGAWQTNDTLRIWVAGAKGGTTDTALLTVRIGAAGTVADTAITGLTSHVLAGAASRSWGQAFDVKLISATSARKVGLNASSTPTYGGASSGVQSVVTAITDASANPLYVSLGFASGGATDTMSVSSAFIELHT